jgi:hypothetical protein
MAGRGTRAWPYRRIAPDAVKAAGWVMNHGTNQEQDLPGGLPDWDYQTDLRLRRSITIDLVECRRSAGLSAEVPLAISVRWNAVPSLVRGAAAWIPLDDDQRDWPVEVVVPGNRLGGVLHIETAVVLAGVAEPRPAVAHRPGSALWNDATEVRLQGDAPLFPIALIPFSKSGLPDKAAWFLELGSDLEASALGAIQLLVNQEHPAAAAVSRAGNPDAVDRAVLSALKSDVIRSMLERAITDEAFEMTEQFEKDSLGAVLQGLVRTYMASHVQNDLLDIRRIHSNDPPLFGAIVQAATEFLLETKR